MVNIQNDLNTDQPATTVYQSLFEIENRLLMEKDINKFLNISIDMAAKISGAERGWIIIYNQENHDVIFQAFKNMKNDDTEYPQFKINQYIIENVTEYGNPVCLPDIQAGMELKQDREVKKVKPLSEICIPLLQDKKIFGMVYMDNCQRMNVFKTETLAFIKEFANFISTAAYSLLEEMQLQNLVANIGKTGVKKGK